MSISTNAAAPEALPVAPSSPQRPAARTGLRRRLKRLLPLTLLGALSIWFAPTLVAKTPLRHYFARQALGELRGSVWVGSASLHWLSPIELRDVTLTDAAGNTIAHIAAISSAKTLFALVRDSSDPGPLTLNQPVITVICTNGSTNIEQAFAQYLADDNTTPPSARRPVTIHFSDGQLILTDSSDNQAQRIEGLTGTVSIPASRSEPITLQVQATTGQLHAQATLGDAHELQLHTRDFPLERTAPLWTRFGTPIRLAGFLTCQLKFMWTHEHIAVVGTCRVDQFAATGPELHGDTLRLASAQLPLDVELAGKRLHVRTFALACDVGTLSVGGTFDCDKWAENLVSQPGITVQAQIELAALAAQLPRLLRIQEGTTFDGGQLTVRLTSHREAECVVWDGVVHASAIEARRAGQKYRWDEPLHMEFTSRSTHGRFPQFDKLIVTADFIALNARTTPDTVQVAANVYLHRLAQRLSQFIDLGALRIDGEAHAAFTAQRDHKARFTASARVELKNLLLTGADNQGLREPAFLLQCQAHGQKPDHGPIQLDEGTLTLRAGTDELTVALIEPVDDLRRLTQGTIDLALQGDLSRWKARIAAVTTIPPYALNGSISARGKVRLAQDRLTIDRLAVELRQVHFHGAGLTIRESTIQATTDVTVSWSTVNRSVRFGSLELQSAALTVADGVLEFRLPQDGPLSVSGQGKCTADLNRVGRIVGLYPEADGPDALHGRGEGPIFFQHAGDVTSFRGSLQVMNFAYGWKNEPSWREPQFTLHVDGRYTDSTDRMAFTTIQVNRPGCLLETTGAIAHVTTTPELNFTGRWQYDWQQLSPTIREWLGRSFTATGTGTRSFTLRGALGSPTAGAVAPLRHTDRPIVLRAPPGSTPPTSPSSFANLEGEAAIGWNSMTLHGFDMGPADITAKMTAGVVTINPLTATLGGGKITLSPTVKLDTTPGELRFASGRIVERAPLTPQAIAGALGYALPAIANAAHAEGEISAILDDNRIPLNDLTQAHLRGSLVIHQAVVGAGPVVAEIAQLLGMEKTSITIVNESTVPVQVAHGRIYHQDFTFRISGTTIKTRGSVGFDNTLDLIVEVPLPKDWPALRNNPILLKAVSGKIVPVPVRGTLARPQVDFRALEQAVRALARASVKDTGRELLERELNQLFPGLPARPNSGPPASPGSPLPFPIPRPFGPKP